MTISLHGIKIVLRDWQANDLDVFAYWLQPGQTWKEFDAPYYPGPSADEIPTIIARQRRSIAMDELPVPRTSLVIADQQTNQLLGLVNWSWESVETNWPLVGIAIYDPTHWSGGIGYEALGLWSDYLFHELPTVARLDLRTWSGNQRMMRLAEKLGYALEARFRKARIVNGAYYDGLGYGILREEWQALYPQSFAATLSLSR